MLISYLENMIPKTKYVPAIILTLCLLTIACQSKKKPVQYTVKDVMFKPESEVDSVAVQEYSLQLPENRSVDSSRTIPVKFLRFESRAENPASPIVYLAGGPGGSGISAAKYRRWELFDRLLDVADVIILDQRGTGRSNTIPECVSSVKIPENQATTKERYVRLHKEALNECLDFWKQEEINIRGYSSWESAADIDAVRRALGVEKVSLLGISYGTHLALATLKRYPDHIDRLVMASSEGLDQTVKLPSRTDAYLDRLQKAINEDSVARSYYPNVKSMIGKALERAEEKPPVFDIPASDEHGALTYTMGKFEMQRITGYQFSDPDRAGSILEGYLKSEEENFNWFRVYKYYDSSPHTISFDGMPIAMELASGISAERLEKVKTQAKTAVLGDATNFPMPHLRGSIPGIELGDWYREPVISDRPALFLSGTLDGRTYPEAMREIAEGFSNSEIITIKNAGHNLFFSHPDLPDIISEFYSGEMPRNIQLESKLPDLRPD